MSKSRYNNHQSNQNPHQIQSQNIFSEKETLLEKNALANSNHIFATQHQKTHIKNSRKHEESAQFELDMNDQDLAEPKYIQNMKQDYLPQPVHQKIQSVNNF